MKKFIPLVLILAVFICALTFCHPDAERIDWENIKLNKVIPEPQSKLMQIISNTENSLSIYVHKIKQNEYFEYQRWCENDKGFNIEPNNIGTNYEAFNQDGYHLSLSYDELDKKMHISLDAPLLMENIDFPQFAIDNGLPIPNSKTGHFKTINKENFLLFINHTTKDEFFNYKSACIDSGFTNKPYEHETAYSASNADGYKVFIKYEGFNTISIEFTSPQGENSNGQDISDLFPDTSSIVENSSIEEFTSEPIDDKPVSKYEKAFVRQMNSYSLYYLFDIDNNDVVFFGTNDTYIENGSYEGEFDSGVTINWSHGEWTEKFIYLSNDSNATLIDGNGFEWVYQLCEVSDAENALAELQ